MAGPLDLDDLTPVAEAIDIVLGETTALGSEAVALSSTPGRVLAADARADVDVPLFDRCAMDGHALRSEDVADAPTSLRVVGTVLAGTVFEGSVEAGQAVKVMTGAPLPAGCDCVQPVERTREEGGRVVIYDAVPVGQHVARAGEDLAAGEVALPAGAVIGPAEVGLLATVGLTEVPVHGRPLCSVLSTGDELVEVGDRPGPGQVRNSNGPMLAVLARTLGCDPVRLLPVARDEAGELGHALERGLESDVLLLSGGVSKGERDLVAGTLTDLGVRPALHGVSMQPGKPVWFGRTERCLVFGLPGNPVSALTTARILAGPAIRRLRGYREPVLPLVGARLTATFSRNPRRTGYLPARISWPATGPACEPLHATGSADLATAARATALWVAPEGRGSFRTGEEVQVLLDELTRPG